MISLKSPGSFEKTQKSLGRMGSQAIFENLDYYGRMGVYALREATPKLTGETAASWGYRILSKSGQVTIEWYNTNVNKGAVIALLIQYGHGTGTGGYVAGYDYINPAARDIFDQISDDVWKKVTG